MLIAELCRLKMDFEDSDDNMMYCAIDPIDGEILTGWYDNILAVDDELGELKRHWGLNLAAYRGESNVPKEVGGEV